MRIRRVLSVVLFLVLAAGCGADARAKRASSLNRVKLTVAAKEYKEAATPEAKLKVAEGYFDSAVPLVNVVDDYLHGRKPDVPPAAPAEKPE
jgi:hypothetical protein